jgi:formate hydrogenlyase transcriptional activator
VPGSPIDSSELFQPAMEASPTAILIADAEGAIVLVNHELERQFGYTQEELIGQPVDLLLPESLPSIPPAEGSTPGDAVDQRAAAGLELVGRRKDGSLFAAEVELTSLRAADGLFVLASVLDIDERHRLEDARRAALEEQLEFERFVAELSFQFINLPDDQVDEAIKAGLGRICRQLGIDRSTFYKIGADGSLTDPVGWSAEGISPLDAPLPARSILPWTSERILAGEVPAFSAIADIPAPIDRASYQAVETKSALTVPLSVNGCVVGALGFSTVLAERTWSAEVRHRLTVIGSVFGQVLARQQRDQAMRTAAREVQRLKDQLQVENVYLRREERERAGLTRIVGQSGAVRRVLDQIQQVAATDSTVLLLGETGTGKELFATQIHELGPRHERAMVRVNCAAIPSTLIESELFGREKGAFTGALARQEGRFELANHSTIFLDEIGDLPPDVQVKLLRVLEERTIERLGSPRPILVDTRIIVATHRNLEQRVAEGTFRADLYYRLNVFPIHVPPLRERVDDIPLLVWRFVEEFSKAFGRRIDSIDRETVLALQHYSWPGNIRELRNVVERAMIVATGRRLTITPPLSSAAASKRSLKLVDIEREHIRGVLESTGWRIRGAGGAADRLGMKPTTLETRMAKLGLTRPGHA